MPYAIYGTQSKIDKKVPKVLLNSHLRNGGIKRNWSKRFIIFGNSLKL